jgi:hypothetical protein
MDCFASLAMTAAAGLRMAGSRIFSLAGRKKPR